MKANRTLLIVTAGILTFTSCKKDNDTNNSTDTEREAIVQISKDQSVTNQLMEDANDVLQEVAAQEDLMGAKTFGIAETMDNLSCATVTVSPGDFPKEITIDFGTTGCMSNGVFRKGIIHVTLSDSLRLPGSQATMIFENYFVQGYHKEGTLTWTNTSNPPSRSWQRTMTNGKITAPGGRYWMHSGTQNISLSEGGNTPLNLTDDAFTITGSSSVTNMNNVTRTATIETPLHKRTICHNVDQGTTRFQGPNHTVILDYGDGTCDNQATISIDGGTPQAITLP